MSQEMVANNSLAGRSYLHWKEGQAQPSSERRVDDTDADLVAGIRSGDEAAFAEVFMRYQRLLLVVASRITKNDHDAEEVVQDAFLKVFQHIKSFHGNSLFRTWLTRIAVNQALMKIRKNRRECLSLDDNGEDGRGSALRTAKAAGVTPEEACSLSEIENMALSLIPRISLSSQPIMKLCVQNELSPAELAEHFNLKLSAAKSRLFRGRKALRDALTQHCQRRRISLRREPADEGYEGIDDTIVQ